MTFTNFIEVFLLAAAPISELRGALPLAINVHEIQWPVAFAVAYAGNLLPVPFLLLLFEPLSQLLSRVAIFKRFIEWILKRARRRQGIVEKYGPIGLTLFVAVPLPITGAWTGSIVAYLLGIQFRHAFPAIALGVLIAGIIVTTLCVIFDMTHIPAWIGAVAAGVVVCIVAIASVWRSWRQKS